MQRDKGPVNSDYPDMTDEDELVLIHLRRNRTDMAFRPEQVASNKIAHSFAVGDPLAQDRHRILLEEKIAFENSSTLSPIGSLSRSSRLGSPSRNKMRSISMSACFIWSIEIGVLVHSELGHAPMPQHAGMQKMKNTESRSRTQRLLQMRREP
jgi:hypothetical protein